MPSTLSKTDQNFVEFARCLYKAKLVVQELEEFSKSIAPSLCLATIEQQDVPANDVLKHINKYLDESFEKLHYMCRVLLVVLEKLESNHPVKKERITSFRYEVMNEWRKTLAIKESLILFIHRTEQDEPEEEQEGDTSESSIEPSSISSST